eukprot:9479923-Pyramimonas_sp.AAC.1
MPVERVAVLDHQEPEGEHHYGLVQGGGELPEGRGGGRWKMAERNDYGGNTSGRAKGKGCGEEGGG